MFRSAGYCSGPGTSIELLKISWLIDCYRIYRGLYYLVYCSLLGIMITHSRETYQPTSIMRWDRGIFNGSIPPTNVPRSFDSDPHYTTIFLGAKELRNIFISARSILDGYKLILTSLLAWDSLLTNQLRICHFLMVFG